MSDRDSAVPLPHSLWDRDLKAESRSSQLSTRVLRVRCQYLRDGLGVEGD